MKLIINKKSLMLKLCIDAIKDYKLRLINRTIYVGKYSIQNLRLNN